jgi:hypothetical protein
MLQKKREERDLALPKAAQRHAISNNTWQGCCCMGKCAHYLSKRCVGFISILCHACASAGSSRCTTRRTCIRSIKHGGYSAARGVET